MSHLREALGISTVRSYYAANNYGRFEIKLAIAHYAIGFRVEEWGVRFMLWSWHICWRPKWRKP